MASGSDSLNFKSKAFDPVKALSSSDVQLPDPDAEEYEDLNSLREAVHSQNLHVVREIPGVLGPGGIPKPVVRQISTERKFTEDQGPIKGRGLRRRRNVITRMEEMTGPLAVLRECQKDNIRVKVYTRNHSEVRGLLTGFVVAFDKHWNLALRDVDEIFQKRLKCKTPALGDVTHFVNVGDMSLRESDSDSREESDDQRKKTAAGGYPPTTKTGQGDAGGWRSRDATRTAGLKGSRDAGRGSGTGRVSIGAEAGGSGVAGLGAQPAGTSAGRGGGRRAPEGGSSASKVVGSVEGMGLASQRSLRLSTQYPETSEAQDARRLRLEGGRKAQEEKEEGEEEVKTKKRVRKRMKREIRKRHVNQLFIRGENVVLVSVQKP
ncbi:uncharacterized protein Lsm11 [Panulirus ornatus]|uniref:uncharacterized protein Lsm11 n=1 Tax=Panulirus ornatus TaxID=150431 RepID=UPI003A8965A7